MNPTIPQSTETATQVELAATVARAATAGDVQIATAEDIDPASANHAELRPGDGVHQELVTITVADGDNFCCVDRFDHLNEDGTPGPLRLDTELYVAHPYGNTGTGPWLAVHEADLADVAKVMTAAAEFVTAYREEVTQ